MTIDITELAQSMKAAANTTADAIDRLKAFPGDELIDLSQHEGEQVDIDIATLNQWYELSSPANILALVEALEKAQQRITQLESRTVKLPLKIERDDADDWFMYKGGRVGGGAAEWYNKALDDVGAELTAAGIKWEVE